MSSSSNRNLPPRNSLFPAVPIIFIVAGIVATLFTAWTEPGLLPSSLIDTFNNALPAAQATENAWPTPTSRPLPHIGIVAGHSGNDPGAVCQDELGGTREVDVNLDVATRVSQLLVQAGYEVDLLREFDPLLQGYRSIALVSIHADSCQYVNDEATGFKVSAAKSTVYPENAKRLTNCLRTRYAASTGLPFHAGSVTPDMSSYHAFSEIHTETPAAIIEIGFLNLDHEILTQKPDLIAQGIANGLLCYIQNEDSSAEPTQLP